MNYVLTRFLNNYMLELIYIFHTVHFPSEAQSPSYHQISKYTLSVSVKKVNRENQRIVKPMTFQVWKFEKELEAYLIQYHFSRPY